MLKFTLYAHLLLFFLGNKSRLSKKLLLLSILHKQNHTNQISQIQQKGTHNFAKNKTQQTNKPNNSKLTKRALKILQKNMTHLPHEQLLQLSDHVEHGSAQRSTCDADWGKREDAMAFD